MFLAGIQACADGRWIPDKLVLVKTGKHSGMTLVLTEVGNGQCITTLSNVYGSRMITDLRELLIWESLYRR